MQQTQDFPHPSFHAELLPFGQGYQKLQVHEPGSDNMRLSSMIYSTVIFHVCESEAVLYSKLHYPLWLVFLSFLMYFCSLSLERKVVTLIPTTCQILCQIRFLFSGNSSLSLFCKVTRFSSLTNFLEGGTLGIPLFFHFYGDQSNSLCLLERNSLPYQIKSPFGGNSFTEICGFQTRIKQLSVFKAGVCQTTYVPNTLPVHGSRWQKNQPLLIYPSRAGVRRIHRNTKQK